MSTPSFFSSVWDTQDEITFIDGLGTHRGKNGPTATTIGDKIKLLQGYLEGLALRKNMVALSREKIEAHVKARIEALSKLDPIKPL